MLRSYFKRVKENNTKMQKALMLHLGGSEVFEIYQLMMDKESEEGFEAAVATINEHFESRLDTNDVRFQLKIDKPEEW